ncbi:MAG: hypothetical protein U0871_04555 [Gemmataceae bacterium]
MGRPSVQLRELYAPLDLLMRDAATLFHLYPEVLCAPEAAGKTSERRMRQAREDAAQVMDQALALVTKMEDLIRAKWDLADRDDVPYFTPFLARQVRLRHASPLALELAPEAVYDGELAERIHDKADAKRNWPFFRLRRPKRTERGPDVRLGMVSVSDPLPPRPVPGRSPDGSAETPAAA